MKKNQQIPQPHGAESLAFLGTSVYFTQSLGGREPFCGLEHEKEIHPGSARFNILSIYKSIVLNACLCKFSVLTIGLFFK